MRIRHQESTSIAGLTTQTISKQFADWANDNKHKYINKKSEASSLAFLLRIGLKDVSMLDEDVLHNEQHSQHVERGVEPLPVHAEHVDKHV